MYQAPVMEDFSQANPMQFNITMDIQDSEGNPGQIEQKQWNVQVQTPGPEVDQAL